MQKTPNSVSFDDSAQSLSQTLTAVAAQFTGETVTLRDILSQLGEQGMLAFCAFLAIPFLIPVTIPGVSTVFGAVIILLGVGVTLNHVPWLPARLMTRSMKTVQLKPALEKGAEFIARFDRFIHPSLLWLTVNTTINRLHGLALTVSGILLIFPFPVPFANFFPALSILFFCFGMMQRDGRFILCGYVMMVVAAAYLLFLGASALAIGQHVIG